MDKSTPRNAATVAVVRDGPEGLETLLLQRAERGDHNSGAWVFPGGLVDPSDRNAPVVGLSDAQASAALGVAKDGLAFYVAALRECLEEAGLVFARDASGSFPAMSTAAAQKLLALRPALQAGEASIAAACEELGLRLAADSLHYVAHWLTPVGRAKRFDTRFFVAVVPEAQESAHDREETLDHVWIRPALALAPENTRRLMTPTRSVLETIAGFDDTSSLLRWSRQPRTVARVLPRLTSDAKGLRPVLPHEPAWEEAGLVDPAGTGSAWAEMRVDEPLQLVPGIWRIAAATGDNSYVVGSGECAIVDPCCAEDAHLEALQRAADGPVRFIVPLTASPAHEAAIARLQVATGAQVVSPRSEAAPLSVSGRTLQFTPGGQGTCVLVDGLLLGGSPDADVASLSPTAAWIAPRQGFVRAVRRKETPQ